MPASGYALQVQIVVHRPNHIVHTIRINERWIRADAVGVFPGSGLPRRQRQP